MLSATRLTLHCFSSSSVYASRHLLQPSASSPWLVRRAPELTISTFIPSEITYQKLLRPIKVSSDFAITNRRSWNWNGRTSKQLGTSQRGNSNRNEKDLLTKLENDEKTKKAWKKGILIGILLLLFGYFFFFKPRSSTKAQFDALVEKLKDPEYNDPQRPPSKLLRELYDDSQFFEAMRTKLMELGESLVPILSRFIRSQDADQRNTAALLLSIISADKANKNRIVQDGLIDVLIASADPATKAATMIVLTNVLSPKSTEKETRAAVLQNRAAMQYLLEHQKDHEPLLRTYAQLALANAGYISLDQGEMNILNMLVKAFDYTRPVDKETMATSMRTLASGNKNDAYIQFCQAYWFQLFGYATEAKLAYSKALQIDPGQKDALFELGRIYMLELQTEKSSLLWYRLLQEDSNFPPLLKLMRERKLDSVRDDVNQFFSAMSALRDGKKVALPIFSPPPPAADTPSVASSGAAAPIPPVSSTGAAGPAVPPPATNASAPKK